MRPICFANGDGGTGRGAAMVREQIFRRFPTIDVPVNVEARLDTHDECIGNVINGFARCGAGFKNSTASNDPRIRERKWQSANIVLRPMANAYAMVRLLQGGGRYDSLCGVIRLATGGFYEERSCESHGSILRTTEELDLHKLERFAITAVNVATKRRWHMILASKRTIAESERIFHDTVATTFRRCALQEGEERGWTGDWHAELSDMALANLSIETGNGRSPNARGGFLFVGDNEVGDTASDIVDHQHGGYTMGSTVYGEIDGKPFTYEELAGGTADAMTTGPLMGENFLSPVGIILAMTAAFEAVNPTQEVFFNAVRHETLNYMNTTPTYERDTERMIAQIAEATDHLVIYE